MKICSAKLDELTVALTVIIQKAIDIVNHVLDDVIKFDDKAVW